jgi:hypothetical protein
MPESVGAAYPIEIERRTLEERIEEIEPVQHWRRWRSLPVLMEVGMAADVGESLLGFNNPAARMMRKR